MATANTPAASATSNKTSLRKSKTTQILAALNANGTKQGTKLDPAMIWALIQTFLKMFSNCADGAMTPEEAAHRARAMVGHEWYFGKTLDQIRFRKTVRNKFRDHEDEVCAVCEDAIRSWKDEDWVGLFAERNEEL